MSARQTLGATLAPASRQSLARARSRGMFCCENTGCSARGTLFQHTENVTGDGYIRKSAYIGINGAACVDRRVTAALEMQAERFCHMHLTCGSSNLITGMGGEGLRGSQEVTKLISEEGRCEGRREHVPPRRASTCTPPLTAPCFPCQMMPLPSRLAFRDAQTGRRFECSLMSGCEHTLARLDNVSNFANNRVRASKSLSPDGSLSTPTTLGEPTQQRPAWPAASAKSNTRWSSGPGRWLEHDRARAAERTQFQKKPWSSRHFPQPASESPPARALAAVMLLRVPNL